MLQGIKYLFNLFCFTVNTQVNESSPYVTISVHTFSLQMCIKYDKPYRTKMTRRLLKENMHIVESNIHVLWIVISVDITAGVTSIPTYFVSFTITFFFTQQLLQMLSSLFFLSNMYYLQNVSITCWLDNRVYKKKAIVTCRPLVGLTNKILYNTNELLYLFIFCIGIVSGFNLIQRYLIIF